MLTFTTDQWIIIGLIFVLGLLVGMWMTSGGRRKWKTRYNEELEQRRTAERTLKEREDHWAGREKEWRERDSLNAAASRDRDVARGDYDRDGIPDRREGIVREGDYDRDGIPNRDDRRPTDDRRY